MRNFNVGHKRFGGGDYKRRDFDQRGQGRPMAFKAVCSECGNDCELPFKPNGRKPVFCSRCFQAHKPSDDHRHEGRYNYNEPRRENYTESYKKQFESLNYKLDTIIKLLSKDQQKEIANQS